MKINEVSFADIIPQNMVDDKTIQGFTAAFNHVIDLYNSKVSLVTFFDDLTLLTEDQLNQVAEAIDIPWYDTSFTLATKQNIVKEYMSMYYKSGTASVIEQTLTNIFGHIYVSPWYEYGGDPFHYTLAISQTMDEDSVRAAAKTLKRITPVRAILDGIVKYLTANAVLYTVADARIIGHHITTKKSEV